MHPRHVGALRGSRSADVSTMGCDPGEERALGSFVAWRALTDRVLPTDFSFPFDSAARCLDGRLRRAEKSVGKTRSGPSTWRRHRLIVGFGLSGDTRPSAIRTLARARPADSPQGLTPSRVRRRSGIPPSSPAHAAGQRTRRGSDPMRGDGLPSLARARSRSPGRSRTPERSEGCRRRRHKATCEWRGVSSARAVPLTFCRASPARIATTAVARGSAAAPAVRRGPGRPPGRGCGRWPRSRWRARTDCGRGHERS